jgi:probable phosphoglycerate mutase
VPSPETRLILIRHGESVAQAKQFLSGHATCVGLSELGRVQAEALRDRLVVSRELGPIDSVFTSSLERAKETERILRPAFGDTLPKAECDWCEIRAGSAEGVSYDDFQERFPSTGDPRDPYTRRIPDGETWAEFFVRAGTRLRRIASEHAGEQVVVVCHGGIIGSSFVALGEGTLHDGVAQTHEAINTSITEWRHTGRRWQLARFNDAAHLAGLARSS